MTITVVVNNYNYERFLELALESVLKQTRPADQIIVVDDGSSDNSVELISQIMAKTQIKNIRLVRKSNGGQLSAFNAVVEILSSDVVAFLDSDDWYEESYLEQLENAMATTKADYILSSYRRVYSKKDSVEDIVLDGDVGVRYLRSVFTHSWFGVPTSAIAITKDSFNRIFPYVHGNFWKTRADEVIIHSCAKLMLNGRYLPEICINYRIHGENMYFCQNHDDESEINQSFLRRYLLKDEYSKVLNLPEKEQEKLFFNELRSSIKCRSFMFSEFFYILKRLKVSLVGRLKMMTNILYFCVTTNRGDRNYINSKIEESKEY